MFTVFRGTIWLQSYVSRWDMPSHPDYSDLPKHSFFKHTPVCVNDGDWSSFQEFRDRCVLYADDELLTSIYFEGEVGYREMTGIPRRRLRVGQTLPEPPSEVVIEDAQPDTPETDTAQNIDFYLPNYTTDKIYVGQHSYHNRTCRVI